MVSWWLIIFGFDACIVTPSGEFFTHFFVHPNI
jgi:hypothetical protein